MKSALDDLPEHKQDELRRVADIIRTETNPGIIILFGSYARGNWVEKLTD